MTSKLPDQLPLFPESPAFGQGRFDQHGLFAFGVCKLKRCGVEFDLMLEPCRAAVERIAHDRAAQLGKLGANLVKTTRFRPYFQQRALPDRFDHAIGQLGKLAVLFFILNNWAFRLVSSFDSQSCSTPLSDSGRRAVTAR